MKTKQTTLQQGKNTRLQVPSFSKESWLIFIFLIFFSLTVAVSCTSDKTQKEKEWPEITSQTKPWVRWWWMGDAVDKENITAQLEAFSNAGLGGVEITPIYGTMD